MNSDRNILALSCWSVSFHYLRLVENAVRETVSQGNIWTMTRKTTAGVISADEYSESTKWSDHTIIIALIFNLLHGIELLVKGYLLVDPTETIGKRHNISELCRRFQNKYPDQNTLYRFFNRYTNDDCAPDLFRHFRIDNGLSIREFYQAFRYPSPDFSSLRNYTSLKYNGDQGLIFFRELAKNIHEARVASVTLCRALENDE